MTSSVMECGQFEPGSRGTCFVQGYINQKPPPMTRAVVSARVHPTSGQPASLTSVGAQVDLEDAVVPLGPLVPSPQPHTPHSTPHCDLWDLNEYAHSSLSWLQKDYWVFPHTQHQKGRLDPQFGLFLRRTRRPKVKGSERCQQSSSDHSPSSHRQGVAHSSLAAGPWPQCCSRSFFASHPSPLLGGQFGKARPTWTTGRINERMSSVFAQGSPHRQIEYMVGLLMIINE